MVPSDSPSEITDDALALQESESCVFSLTRALSGVEKEMIVQQLSQSHDDMIEALQEVQGSCCDLMEVGCGLDSGFSKTVQTMGNCL